MRLHILAEPALILVCCAAWASDADDASALYDEAQEAMRKMSGVAADPKVYAEAVRKLERAQELAEGSRDADEDLKQNISAALFWAKKFANVNVIAELQHTAPVVRPEKSKEVNNAEVEFKKAEAFEAGHAGNDYAIALRWFQVADTFAGTDYAQRAQARAQEAQARYQASQASKTGGEPQTEDEKLIALGNELFLSKNYEEAVVKFEDAKKIKDSSQVERRLGHANYELGFKASDEYTSRYLELRSRGDAAGLQGLKSLVAKAHGFYKAAETAFKKGLDLAKSKDLDCETQLAFICYYNNKNAQYQTRMLLLAMLKKYAPANDEERTVYEGGRALYKKLGGTEF